MSAAEVEVAEAIVTSIAGHYVIQDHHLDVDVTMTTFAELHLVPIPTFQAKLVRTTDLHAVGVLLHTDDQ